MRVLDLFCCAGGAAMGYYRAFGPDCEIVGIDINPQPHYPFQFVRADALEYVAEHGTEFDFIHASPPCQFATELKSLYSGTNYNERHANFIPQTRQELRASGRPYVIENVRGARKYLIGPIMLCGSMFSLKVYRHRYFECAPWMLSPGHSPHRDNTPAVGRGVSDKGFISVTGTGGFGIPGGFEYAQRAMGIDWMSRREMSQAIPPVYTEWIGRQLLAAGVL